MPADLWFSGDAERAIAYDARASVADFDRCMQEYDRLALAAARDRLVPDLSYGQHAAERLDLFPAVGDGRGAPVVFAIHGGYWRARTKRDMWQIVQPMTEAGVAVACVEYALLPEVELGVIVHQVRSAIAWLLGRAGRFGIDPERASITGSSAGAQLAAMTLAPQWGSHYGLGPRPVRAALLLSGLFDLRPLVETPANDWMRLDDATAAANSPITLPRLEPNVRVSLAVGGLEPVGFRNQTWAYAEHLRLGGTGVAVHDEASRHHFNLLSELADPGSRLGRELLDMSLQA